MKKARSLPCLKSLILLVEQRGIEPLASALRTRRSAKLSYCPTAKTRKLQTSAESTTTCGRHENTVSSFEFQVDLVTAVNKKIETRASQSVPVNAQAIRAATRALFFNKAMLACRVAPLLSSDMRASRNGVKSRPEMLCCSACASESFNTS